MRSKAQAGLEYLMTYGWALILIASVIGVLVFIVSSPSSEGVFSVSDSTRFLLKGGLIDESNNVEVLLQNISGGRVKVTNVDLDGTSFSGSTLNGVETSAISASNYVEVIPGGELRFAGITYSGSGRGTITVDYLDFANLERAVVISGSKGGSSGGGGGTPECIPSGEEVCTGGVDEDCDGAVDCADADCSSDPGCVACEDECTQDGCQGNTPYQCVDGEEGCMVRDLQDACGTGYVCESGSCVLDSSADCSGKSEGEACLTSGTCDSEGRCLGPELLQNSEFTGDSSWLPVTSPPPPNNYPGFCGIGMGKMNCSLAPGTSVCGPAGFEQVLSETQSGTHLITLNINVDNVNREDEFEVLMFYKDGTPITLTSAQETQSTVELLVENPEKLGILISSASPASTCQPAMPPLSTNFESISMRKLLG